jgi:hypothetical protein
MPATLANVVHIHPLRSTFCLLDQLQAIKVPIGIDLIDLSESLKVVIISVRYKFRLRLGMGF